MLPITLPTPPLRRLAAVLLALSVLLTTLGWAHPSCEDGGPDTAAPQAMTGHGGHVAARTAHDACDDAAHHAAAARGGDDRSGHDHPGTPAADACALVAHCASAAIAAMSAAPAPRVQLTTGPAARSDARPGGPSYQPDAPPPKV